MESKDREVTYEENCVLRRCESETQINYQPRGQEGKLANVKRFGDRRLELKPFVPSPNYGQSEGTVCENISY